MRPKTQTRMIDLLRQGDGGPDWEDMCVRRRNALQGEDEEETLGRE
jgi:hypothetical protein